MTTLLKNMGAAALGQKRIDDQKPRIWAIRNQGYWRDAAESEIAVAYRAAARSAASQPTRISALPPDRRVLGASVSGDVIPNAVDDKGDEIAGS